MYENLQFIESFGKQQIDPLLRELLDNIEPMDDLNGMHFDDVISISSDEMRHSQSASSISSLNSADQFSNSFDCAQNSSHFYNYDQQNYYNGR